MVGYQRCPRAVPWTALITARLGVAHAERQFTGRAVRRTCHPDIYADFYKNSHVRTIQTDDAPPDGSGCGGCHGPGAALPDLRAALTLPTRFESPQARVPVRLHQKLRWNACCRCYRDRVDFSTHLQRDRAHTGFTSVPWTF